MAKVNTKEMSSAATAENFHIVPLSDIYVDPKWNARSDLGQASGGPEETTGLQGLKLSIGTKGQDTPIIVRPRYQNEKFRQPYFLVAGFRRITVIAELAAQNKDPKPTIKAFIRNISEAEARELNLRENTARENLSGPDLAFGVAAMARAAKQMGAPLTQQGISLALNLSQPYVGKMLSIAEIKGTYIEGGKTIPILEHWRDSVAKVTVEQMYRVSKVEDEAKQTELYTEFVRGSKGKDGRDPKVKLEGQIKQATKWGRVLGILVYEGAIDIQDDDVFFSTYLDKFMSLSEDMKAHDKHKVVDAAEKAFQLASENGEAGDEEKGEEKSEAKAKPAKKKSAKAHTSAN